ncbi:MAG: NAD(P)-dependent oxidoreductase [Rhizobiales bacterium]|nr:NAD(P)-dependent oxidoreductase [Hyphomicrobiales bacterium]
MGDGIRVGFLGVGLMGHGAAKNILEKGYPLAILGHRNRAPVEDLVARGAVEAADAAALAATSDVVIICVPSGVEMEAAFAGPRGLMAGARPGTIFVDATTNDPAVTRKVGAELAAIGCDLVDAAMGRTPKEAEEGRLATYVGGDPATIEKVRPILETYADTIVVCGGLGAGTTCKLVNNSVTIGMVAVISEAFATAAKIGVDLEALSAVLSAGGANGGMWQMLKPWILEGDDSRLKGPIRIGAKDIRTYGRMAENAGVATFIAQAVNQTLRLALNQGHAERYLSVLPGILAELNGAKIRDV